jgi:hypothetical protein
VIIQCPQIENEVRDEFVRYVGQWMLDKNSIKQPQPRKLIQNRLEKRIQKIILGEGQFVQNKQEIHNFPNVSRA